MHTTNDPMIGRVTQVEEQMGALERAIELAVEAQEKLGIRLGSLLRSEPSHMEADVRKEVELVPLAARLRALTDRVNYLERITVRTSSQLEL